jgi:hypothetical protein
MSERDTHRVNTEARAEMTARRPRADADSALSRYLAASAYHEAGTENETDDVNEEAVHEHPAAPGESGAEHR